MKNTLRYGLICTTTLFLAACQTTQSGDVWDAKEQSTENRINAAIDKTTIRASGQNIPQTPGLRAVEDAYKKDSGNAIHALNYAQSLRQIGQHKHAQLILEPFAKGQNSAPAVNKELSLIALGLGDYTTAELYAKDAILQDTNDYQAYQSLGIALDAKEMHVEAERAFRKSLENWQGNPTSVMNNLALNLATQGFIDEAIEILERAKTLSPDRIELERNLRIIRTLNER